jgi:hypothetical protein
MIFESAALFIVVRRRLGIHAFVVPARVAPPR